MEIDGTRSTIVRDLVTDQLKPTGSSNMELVIDLAGADPAGVLPRAADLLFFPDMNAAIGALPLNVATMVPGSSSGFVKPACRCRMIFADHHWLEVANGDPRMQQVSLVRRVEPEYSEEARRAKLSGAVRLAFVVDAKGVPTDVWLLNSVGLGLDEQAETAIRSYRFAPARYDNVPIEVEIAVEISFSIFGRR